MAEKPDQSAPLQSTPKINLKLWIVIGILALTVGIDLTLRVIGYFGDPRPTAAAGAPGPASKEARSKPGEHEKRIEVKAIVPLDPFLVNLADKEAVCYLKATFQLGMSEENEELKGGGEGGENPVRAAARDTIITLLGSKSSDQILTTEGKERLREEIRNRVNAVLPTGKVQEVYITDFVVSQ